MGALPGDVAGGDAVVERLGHGRFDAVGGLAVAQGVAQQHSARENLGQRIGNALARDVGSRAARRLEEPEGAFGKRGRGKHAERPGDGASLVGEDVSEEIGTEHHVELARVAHQLHGGVVHVEVIELHVRELVLVNPNHRLAPQHRDGQHVGFVNGGDVVAAQAGCLEGLAGDAFDLGHGVDHGVVALHGRTFAVASLGLSEVGVSGELAHHQDVEAFAHDVGAQRAGCGQSPVHGGRAQVGVESEDATQRKQRTAFGLQLRSQLFPLGAAYRTEEDGLGGSAGGNGAFRQRMLKLVVSGSAHLGRGPIKAKPLLGTYGFQHAYSFGHHFWSDAIACQHRDPMRL